MSERKSETVSKKKKKMWRFSGCAKEDHGGAIYCVAFPDFGPYYSDHFASVGGNQVCHSCPPISLNSSLCSSSPLSSISSFFPFFSCVFFLFFLTYCSFPFLFPFLLLLPQATIYKLGPLKSLEVVQIYRDEDVRRTLSPFNSLSHLSCPSLHSLFSPFSLTLLSSSLLFSPNTNLSASESTPNLRNQMSAPWTEN